MSRETKRYGLAILILSGIVGFIANCEEPIPVQDELTVTLTDPTNAQRIPLSYEFVGSVYDSMEIAEVTLTITPVYGGMTNEFSPNLINRKFQLYRQLVNFEEEGFYYVWAEAENISNKTVSTRVMLIEVVENLKDELLKNEGEEVNK